MRLPDWFGTPRHLLVWLLLATAVPTLALFLLVWQLVANEADLSEQHRNRLRGESLQVSADLRQHLDRLALDDQSVEGAGDTLFVAFRRGEVESHHGQPLLFVPGLAARLPADDARAMGIVLAAGRDRAAGRLDGALQGYGSLTTFPDHVTVFGGPAPLEGALARVRLLSELLKRPDDAGRESIALRHDLERGRWRIDRISFENAWAQIAQRTPPPASYPPAFALVAAADTLMTDWMRGALRSGAGTRAERIEGLHITLLWRTSAETLSVRVIPTASILRPWTDRWKGRNLHVALLEADGQSITEPAGAVEREAVSTSPIESGLPWVTHVSSVSPEIFLADERWRRRQLRIILGLAVALTLAGAFFVARAVRRELAVAQLQKDFVSAVSHEFRTPLTSMSHLVELLRGDRPIDNERRRRYYDALEQETSRLRRFVDTLLDFGRVQSGVARYDLEPEDAHALTLEVIDRFRNDPSSGGRAVDLTASVPLPPVRVDREAVGLVVRNLLENAVKYAPATTAIRVELDSGGSSVTLTVRDDGPGIPSDEQHAVFEAFVRGAAARSARIKGTGVGLSLSRQIVRAHGGDLTLRSEPGKGAAFTVTLPALSHGGDGEAN